MIAVMAAVGLAFGSGDYLKKEVNVEKGNVTTTFKYDPSSLTWNNITNTASYQISTGGVSCPGGSSTPCKIVSDEHSSAEELVDFLMENFENNQSGGINYVRDLADGFKN